MNFKDRIGTGIFSLTDKHSGTSYTMKLQANFMNLKKFESITGVDNPVTYLALNMNSATAPVEILYNFMVDFYETEKPNVSLVEQMDRDNIIGWMSSCADNKDDMDALQKAVYTISGMDYEKLLAEKEKQAKKKGSTKAA
ncbi:hypothetical protein [Sphingobium chungangianum]